MSSGAERHRIEIHGRDRTTGGHDSRQRAFPSPLSEQPHVQFGVGNSPTVAHLRSVSFEHVDPDISQGTSGTSTGASDATSSSVGEL
jgi:hypothetical protein